MMAGMQLQAGTFLLVRDLTMMILAGLLFYYVYSLEQEKCDCSIDWRRQYIYYFTIGIFIYILLAFIIPSLRTNFLMANLLAIAAGFNLYCVYTYVRDLEVSNCVCAVRDHFYIHDFLKFQSLIGVIIICFIAVILISLILSNILGGIMSKSEKSK